MALIFDVDGTLADTEELHRQAFNEAFFACGVNWRWGPALYAELLQNDRWQGAHGELPQSTAGRRGGARAPVAPHPTDPRYQDPGLTRNSVALGHLPPRAGVRRLIMEARKAGLRLAIASTTSPENVESLLTAGFGADSRRVFSGDRHGWTVVPRKKPAPDIYNFALERLGVPGGARNCVEDSEVGARSAKGRRPVYGCDPEPTDHRPGFPRGRRGSLVHWPIPSGPCMPSTSCGAERNTWGWINSRPCTRPRYHWRKPIHERRP